MSQSVPSEADDSSPQSSSDETSIVRDVVPEVATPSSTQSPLTTTEVDSAAVSPAPAHTGPTLDEQLSELQVPPPWLEDVTTSYDTNNPWSEARLEIRRLLGLNQDESRREAIKLTWIYLQKNDIGDGHEYPMYMYLGGEPVWAVQAYEEFIAKPHPHPPFHAMLSLASLYKTFGEFERAEATLQDAMDNPPEPPWEIASLADVNAAFGDLYADLGRTDEARTHYAEAIRLYPTSNQPYGQHELNRKAAIVQTRLDLLDAQALSEADLQDGTYQTMSLGYSGDLHVTLSIVEGRIADVQISHQEKIDQNACVIIPRRIVEQQSLDIDGVSGATVTKNAIVDAVFQGLREAAH